MNSNLGKLLKDTLTEMIPSMNLDSLMVTDMLRFCIEKCYFSAGGVVNEIRLNEDNWIAFTASDPINQFPQWYYFSYGAINDVNKPILLVRDVKNKIWIIEDNNVTEFTGSEFTEDFINTFLQEEVLRRYGLDTSGSNTSPKTVYTSLEDELQDYKFTNIDQLNNWPYPYVLCKDIPPIVLREFIINRVTRKESVFGLSYNVNKKPVTGSMYHIDSIELYNDSGYRMNILNGRWTTKFDIDTLTAPKYNYGLVAIMVWQLQDERFNTDTRIDIDIYDWYLKQLEVDEVNNA